MTGLPFFLPRLLVISIRIAYGSDDDINTPAIDDSVKISIRIAYGSDDGNSTQKSLAIFVQFKQTSPSLTFYFSFYLCTFPVRILQAETVCFRFAPSVFYNTLSFLPAIRPSTALDTGTSSTPSRTPGKPSFPSTQAERSSLPHRNLFPVQTTLPQYYLLLLLP